MSAAGWQHNWLKSSHSSNENCVEVALTSKVTAVRDSKDPDGPTLAFTTAAFSSFLDAARTGHIPHT